MNSRDAPVGEKAIHAAIDEVVMARQYHEDKNPKVTAFLNNAFEQLLDALGEHRNDTPCSGRISIRLTPWMLERIDEIAKESSGDRSSVIREALYAFLPKPPVTP